ncbi:EFR1 family ferrodoxin [uncultured Methanoregula sp.]|uniref:EFR1 family ferrodoxin n=1 Tax=uncultured Methanoregula sp. TaxID=1005933 RepID=UPI002AAA8A99|nr:EFR1 family ferrodoxin [uncultured Methanoregula sp.]
MKTIIYYFTGTGNSLAAAKKIAAVLGDCEMVPVALLQNAPAEILPGADRVGIVCPVYDAGVPRIVAEFAGRLDLSRAGYTFAVVTMGGMGVSALHQLNAILTKVHGRKLDAAFAVKMPGNFPPVGKIAAPEKQQKILKSTDARLAEIARTIDKGLLVPPGFSPVSSLMRSFLYPPFYKNVHEMDKAFSVSDACTSCGTCTKVCPVGNITLVNKRPSWQHHCELCCACLHFCPVEAIQLHMMQGTAGRGRYRHPDLTAADMKAQRGEES